MTSDRFIEFQAALEALGRMAADLMRDEKEEERLRWEVERLGVLLVERDEQIRKLQRGLANLSDERTRDREELICKLKTRLQACRMALASANEDITGDDERTKFNEVDYWLVLRGEAEPESVGLEPCYMSIHHRALAALEQEIGEER